MSNVNETHLITIHTTKRSENLKNTVKSSPYKVWTTTILFALKQPKRLGCIHTSVLWRRMGFLLRPTWHTSTSVTDIHVNRMCR